MLCHFVNCNTPLKEYSTPCSQCLQLLYCVSLFKFHYFVHLSHYILQSDECQSAQVTLHGQHCQNLAPPNLNEEIIEEIIDDQRNLYSYIFTFRHLIVRHALSLLGFSDLGQGLNIQEVAEIFQQHTRYDFILVIKLLKDPASKTYGYPRWSKLAFSLAYIVPTSPEEKQEIQNLLTNKPASSLVIGYHAMDSLADLYSRTNHRQYYVHTFDQPPSAIPIVSLRHFSAAIMRCEEALLHGDEEGDEVTDNIISAIYSGDFYVNQDDFYQDGAFCVPEDGNNEESDSSDDYTIHTPDSLF